MKGVRWLVLFNSIRWYRFELLCFWLFPFTRWVFLLTVFSAFLSCILAKGHSLAALELWNNMFAPDRRRAAYLSYQTISVHLYMKKFSLVFEKSAPLRDNWLNFVTIIKLWTHFFTSIGFWMLGYINAQKKPTHTLTILVWKRPHSKSFPDKINPFLMKIKSNFDSQ